MVNNYHGAANNKLHQFLSADVSLLDIWFKSAFIPKGNMVIVKGCSKIKYFFVFRFFPHLLSIVLWDTFHLQCSNSYKRATRINIWKFLKAQFKKSSTEAAVVTT